MPKTFQESIKQVQQLVATKKYQSALARIKTLEASELPEAEQDELLLEKAKCLLKCNRFNESLQIAEQLYPKNNYRFLYIYVESLENLGRQQEAIDLINSSNCAHKDKAQIMLARIYGRSDDISRACEILIAESKKPRSAANQTFLTEYYYWMLMAGRYDEAKRYHQQCLKQDTTRFLTVKTYSYALMRVERYHDAIAVLEQAIKFYSDPLEHNVLFLNLANCYKNIGNRAKAKEICERIIASSKKPGSLNTRQQNYVDLAQVDLAWSRYKLGEIQQAEDELKKIISNHPSSAHAVMNLAYIYYETRRYEDAVQLLNSFLTHSSNHLTALLLKVNCLMLSDETDQAENLIDKLHYQYPNDSRVTSIYISIHDGLGTISKEKFLAGKCAKNPSDVDLFVDYVMYLFVRFQYKKVLMQLQNVRAERFPNNKLLLYAHAYSLSKLGQYDQAEPLFRELVTRFPDYLAGHYTYINHLIFKGSVDEADHHLAAFTKRFPYDSKIYQTYAAVCNATGQSDLCIDTMVVDGKPIHKSAGLCLAIAVAYYNLNDLVHAKQFAANAIELDSRYDSAYSLLGHIASANGHYKEARRLYDVACEINPNRHNKQRHNANPGKLTLVKKADFSFKDPEELMSDMADGHFNIDEAVAELEESAQVPQATPSTGKKPKKKTNKKRKVPPNPTPASSPSHQKHVSPELSKAEQCSRLRAEMDLMIRTKTSAWDVFKTWYDSAIKMRYLAAIESNDLAELKAIEKQIQGYKPGQSNLAKPVTQSQASAMPETSFQTTDATKQPPQSSANQSFSFWRMMTGVVTTVAAMSEVLSGDESHRWRL